MKEKKLIASCTKQSRKAQRLLFEKYYKGIFRLVRRYLGDYHDTEDVVLIVFNKALKNIGQLEYRGEGSLQKWLNTIAINESIRALRKIKPIYHKEEIEERITIPNNTAKIDIEMVHRIMEQMPPGYRTVFNLYAIDGHSHSEIAAMLNISRNTSKSQLLKARKFIIQALNKQKDHERKSFG